MVLQPRICTWAAARRTSRSSPARSLTLRPGAPADVRLFAPRRSRSHAHAQAHSRCALLVHQVGRPANFGGTAIQQFRQPGRLSDEESNVGARAPGRAADGVQGGEPAESGRSLSRGRGGRRAVSGKAGALSAERVRPRAHVSGDEQQEQRAGDGRELQSQQYGPAGRERFQ